MSALGFDEPVSAYDASSDGTHSACVASGAAARAGLAPALAGLVAALNVAAREESDPRNVTGPKRTEKDEEVDLSASTPSGRARDGAAWALSRLVTAPGRAEDPAATYKPREGPISLPWRWTITKHRCRSSGARSTQKFSPRRVAPRTRPRAGVGVGHGVASTTVRSWTGAGEGGGGHYKSVAWIGGLLRWLISHSWSLYDNVAARAG